MCPQCLPCAVGSPQAASSVICMLWIHIFCVCVGMRMLGISMLSKPLLHMLGLHLPQDTNLGGYRMATIRVGISSCYLAILLCELNGYKRT